MLIFNISYMNISEKAELTPSICHIGKPTILSSSKSGKKFQPILKPHLNFVHEGCEIQENAFKS